MIRLNGVYCTTTTVTIVINPTNQFDVTSRDKMAEGRACSNLGIVYQLLGDHDAALKLHQAHLNIARVLQDRAGMGRAYGNIGNAYSAMSYYEQAIKYHKQVFSVTNPFSLSNIFKLLSDRLIIYTVQVTSSTVTTNPK